MRITSGNLWYQISSRSRSSKRSSAAQGRRVTAWWSSSALAAWFCYHLGFGHEISNQGCWQWNLLWSSLWKVKRGTSTTRGRSRSSPSLLGFPVYCDYLGQGHTITKGWYTLFLHTVLIRLSSIQFPFIYTASATVRWSLRLFRGPLGNSF